MAQKVSPTSILILGICETIISSIVSKHDYHTVNRSHVRIAEIHIQILITKILHFIRGCFCIIYTLLSEHAEIKSQNYDIDTPGSIVSHSPFVDNSNFYCFALFIFFSPGYILLNCSMTAPLK